MTKSNIHVCLFATVPCLVPEKMFTDARKNNGKWTGSWFASYFSVKSTDVFCSVY